MSKQIGFLANRTPSNNAQPPINEISELDNKTASALLKAKGWAIAQKKLLKVLDTDNLAIRQNPERYAADLANEILRIREMYFNEI